MTNIVMLLGGDCSLILEKVSDDDSVTSRQTGTDKLHFVISQETRNDQTLLPWLCCLLLYLTEDEN